MRYELTEAPHVLGKFDSGDTVTISLYDISTGAAVALTSGSCSEIGATGVFKWAASDIQTQPTAFAEYLWVMSNGAISAYGKLTLGGYPDLVSFALKFVANRMQLDSTTNQLRLYDDDGVTVIHTFNLLDAAGQPATSNVFDRVPA